MTVSSVNLAHDETCNVLFLKAFFYYYLDENGIVIFASKVRTAPPVPTRPSCYARQKGL